jgi:hypothetical protein
MEHRLSSTRSLNLIEIYGNVNNPKRLLYITLIRLRKSLTCDLVVRQSLLELQEL